MANYKALYAYDKQLYRQRSMIENLFACLKAWRPIATRCDLCASTVMPVMAFAMNFLVLALTNESWP